MCPSIRGALALLLVIASTSVLAAPPERAQLDAQGRVVRDANGRRHTYGPGASGSVPAAVPRAKPAVPTAKLLPAFAKAGPAPTAVVPAQSLAAATYVENWRFNNWGWGIGLRGFWPVDLDANGDKEVIYGLGGGQWAIADYDAVTREYQVLWKSPAGEMAALRVVESGNTKHVWISRGDSIDVYDAITHALVRNIALPAGVYVSDFAYADGNNDGSTDVVALASDRMFFFNPTTFVAAATIQVGSQSFAIGNVDADPALEIVLSDGRVVVVTGATHVVQFQHTASFGTDVQIADIDGDGRGELVAPQGWYVQAWDLDVPAVKWQHSSDSGDIALARLYDVTGDGKYEVLYADGQWGAIHALDGVTHTELWSVPNPEYGVTDVGIFDADGDGNLELFWGAGHLSSGPDYLYVFDVASRLEEYQSFDVTTPYIALDVGDVDNDGRAELVVASYQSNSGYADGVLFIFDAVTHALEYRGPTNMFEGSAFTGVRALHIANVDSDPQAEILVGTDLHYDGRLYVIDGLTHAVEHAWPFDSGSPLSQLAAADVDGDGQLDVLAGNSVAHTGSPGTFFRVINPRTGATLWKSQPLSNWIAYPQAADVGSPGMDLLAVSGNVLRIRWSDKQQIASLASNYSSVVAMDVSGTPALEIVAGRFDGAIDVLDGDSLMVLATHPGACPGNLIGATVIHGPRSLALVCNTSIVVYDLTTSSVVSSVNTGMQDNGTGALARFVSQGKSAFFVGGEWPAVFLDLSGNSVPALVPRTASLHWRSNIDVTISGSDLDNDPLTYQISRLPALGTASWLSLATGTLRYTAAGTSKGTDTMQLRAYDGFQYSDPQTLTLTLTNTAPTTTMSALSLHWRGAQTTRLTGSDPNADPLTFALGAAPTRGQLTLVNAANGDVRFEPAGAFVGADTFAYTVSDGPDVSAAQSVQLTLTNSVPTAPNPAYAVVIGNTVAGRVAGADANSDPLTYAVTTAPSRGTFTLDAATGLFEYVPVAGSGNVTAQVVVRDGVSESVRVTVTFNYTAASAPSSGGGGGGGGSFDLLILVALALALARRLRSRPA